MESNPRAHIAGWGYFPKETYVLLIVASYNSLPNAGVCLKWRKLAENMSNLPNLFIRQRRSVNCCKISASNIDL
jgi:hypothetical protein